MNRNEGRQKKGQYDAKAKEKINENKDNPHSPFQEANVGVVWATP